MERPASLSVIASLFFLVAAYLVVIGVLDLISPGTLSAAAGAPITYGRELDGPQTAISVGLGWALVGWGLLQVRSWARWCAIGIMVLGIASSIPAVSAAARSIGWRFFWYGAQVMIRVVITWYLAQSPEISDAFKKKIAAGN
jgi:hypothetical protein